MSSLEPRKVAWVINSRGLAKNVKNAGLPAAYQSKDSGANMQCPNCHYIIDNGDASNDWPGLPAGVKFDPSDIELLEHLAAKHGVGDLEPHKFIDEFIPTLQGDEGICYTHPENLPGAKKDGSSVHFFYKITNAYSTGQRKRRRIQYPKTMADPHVRWHKTGKTKAILENGVHKGFKKIMVLYATKGGSKPDKCKWVMHQFHLGTDENEKQGDYVVSKVFYQVTENDRNESCMANAEPDMGTIEVIPMTPKTNTPDPPRSENTPPPSGADDYFVQSLLTQEPMRIKEPCHYASLPQLEEEMLVEYSTPPAEESETVELCQGQSLFCGEVIDTYPHLGVPRPSDAPFSAQVGNNTADIFPGIDDLNNLELDTPPDFLDLQFDSQDSIFDWLDRL